MPAITRGQLHDMTMVMVLARLQAEGKKAATMSRDQMQPYIDDAVADIKLALDLTGTEVRLDS